MTRQRHGGNRYGQDIMMDFSVNINPLGMPEYIRTVLETAENTPLWEWYPDPDCGRLRQALSAYHGVPAQRIVCGNGASELIFAIVRAVVRGIMEDTKNNSRPVCLLPVPSFSEYERALRAAGAEIRCYPTDERQDFILTEDILEALTERIGLLFLCNPANPTGSLLHAGLLGGF